MRAEMALILAKKCVRLLKEMRALYRNKRLESAPKMTRNLETPENGPSKVPREKCCFNTTVDLIRTFSPCISLGNKAIMKI